jgi:SAM-dependent methyltransferase
LSAPCPIRAPDAVPAAPANAAAAHNQEFYDALWADTYLVHPERFGTWPLVAGLAAAARTRLEIGAGMRPRLPLAGTTFVDLSARALAVLRGAGGRPVRADATTLPFRDGGFDLACVLDLVEHVTDDERVFAELARVVAPGGVLLLSTPLHAASWTEFDALAGHVRRYEPGALIAQLAASGFALEQSAVYGMQPRSRTLARIGVWWLTRRHAQAMRFYNRLLMPLLLLFERPPALRPGLVDTDRVDEVLLVCRRR